MDLDKLYEQKGRLSTQIEILQAQLVEVNKQIVEHINADSQMSLNGASKEVQASE